MTISELKQLKESEDKVEFKAAMHNFSYAGSDHRDQEERRKCFLGYVVAFAILLSKHCKSRRRNKMPTPRAMDKINELKTNVSY